MLSRVREVLSSLMLAELFKGLWLTRHYLFARKPPERGHDPDRAGGRRLDPPHADA